MTQLLRFLPLSLLVVLLDQITKYWAYYNLRFKPDVQVINNFFKLSYAENPGIAFGVLSDIEGNWKVWLLSTVSFIAISLVTYFAYNAPPTKKLLIIALTLILGGIIGNLIDRLHLQVVIDFLEFYVGSYHWPTFNIADMAICIGAGLLSIDILTETSETNAEVEANKVKEQ